MKNRDKLSVMSNQELSELFCKAMEGIAENTKGSEWCCNICPAKDICEASHNGFLAWLEKEVE